MSSPRHVRLADRSRYIFDISANKLIPMGKVFDLSGAAAPSPLSTASTVALHSPSTSPLPGAPVCLSPPKERKERSFSGGRAVRLTLSKAGPCVLRSGATGFGKVVRCGLLSPWAEIDDFGRVESVA